MKLSESINRDSENKQEVSHKDFKANVFNFARVNFLSGQFSAQNYDVYGAYEDLSLKEIGMVVKKKQRTVTVES